MMKQSTPLQRLSVMTGRQDLSDLHIPTITEGVESVHGLKGRIRLQNVSGGRLDVQRSTLQAYEYLCHIGEAKEWIENCLQETIDPIIKLEDSMKDGIVLAKLAHWFAPGIVQRIISDTKHKFLLSENINYFFKSLQAVRLPQIFWFELTDLYDKKNIPKVIYCIHALSHLLARRNMAPNIKNLFGELQFTNEELKATQKILDGYNVIMPNFTTIGSSLRKELGEDEMDFPLDSDFQFQTIDMTPFGMNDDMFVSSPELIGEDSDSEEETTEFFSPIFRQQQEKQPEVDEKAYWAEPMNVKKLVKCQSVVRKWLTRREYDRMQQIHQSTYLKSSVNHLQARVRGALVRRELEKKRITLTTCDENWVIKLQAASRGFISRRKLKKLVDSIDRNVRKEGFTMNKLVHNVHQELVAQKNPSVGTVKNFIHLLDDSDLDYDTEFKLESIRQEVIQTIRENNQLDTHVNTIDTKIALLVRNAITIEEVLKVTGPLRKKEQQRRFSLLAATAEAEASSSSSTAIDPFTLKSINQKNHNTLELYQQLVYLLQTNPKYLAKLVSLTAGKDFGGYGDGHKRIESTILALFGYATNTREEYLLLNLCRFCIDEEIQLVNSPKEFMCGNYTFMKLAVQTNRGAKEYEFFRTLLTPLINEVINNEFLDLETDPVGIYRKVINEEEDRTGLPSRRKHSVNSQEALADEEVKNKFISHLRNLREITEKFVTAITSTLDELPYSIRVIARELRLVLEQKFPSESSGNIIKILAYFIYYRYLNPAIVSPEQYDVIDHNIDSHQRKNLAEISRMLQQISSGKIFDANDLFLAPLNDYVADAGYRFEQWFLNVTDVEEPEVHFERDALDDHTRITKPNVYISPYELCHLHYMLEQHIDDLVPNGKGPLFEIMQDLGPSSFQPGVQLPKTTRCLQLSNRYEDIPQDPNTQLQQLITDTKRLVIYVIQIQSGRHLGDIFEQPVTAEHENQWTEVKKNEFSAHDGSSSNRHESIANKRRILKLGNTPLDINNLSFSQLKTIAFRLTTHLGKYYEEITNENNYQGVLNMIAEDITGKNSRRQSRQREISKLSTTLTHLQTKKAYLSEQRQNYEDYLKLSMDTMAKKRGKKQRFVWPFSRQYFHMRTLHKQGMVPTFGSFKYTAKQLHDRGIILHLEGVEKKYYDRITITLSMDEAGIINFEGNYSNWSATAIYMDVQYEHLLQTQFEGIQSISLLDGMVKVNVNLLIYMINKKFYSA
ncbi:hypothetical protein BJ944DRAFT_246306 [Cunninghamella echinulata]|nr:hypothetical protein BJ944DRAFT_246306 [Cunninghamella echinulata]